MAYKFAPTNCIIHPLPYKVNEIFKFRVTFQGAACHSIPTDWKGVCPTADFMPIADQEHWEPLQITTKARIPRNPTDRQRKTTRKTPPKQATDLEFWLFAITVGAMCRWYKQHLFFYLLKYNKIAHSRLTHHHPLAHSRCYCNVAKIQLMPSVAIGI